MLFSLKQIKSNINAVYLGSYIYYFSYETCICIYDSYNKRMYIDDTKYSITTSKHVKVIKNEYDYLNPDTGFISVNHTKFVRLMHTGLKGKLIN